MGQFKYRIKNRNQQPLFSELSIHYWLDLDRQDIFDEGECQVEEVMLKLEEK
ncbi:MAG: hypothetical protein K8R75_04045 [Deltaproteobacteria bacterium]|nr:hypothetical protein [Deltaproteobacteria bacterium]